MIQLISLYSLAKEQEEANRFFANA